MIAGLASQLPRALTHGLPAHGVPYQIAHHAGHLPPVSSLFSAVLGVNPVAHLLAPSGALSQLTTANQHLLTGTEFFSHLISAPFHHGLQVVFIAAAALSVLAAFASLSRGGRQTDASVRGGRPRSTVAPLSEEGAPLVTTPPAAKGRGKGSSPSFRDPQRNARHGGERWRWPTLIVSSPARRSPGRTSGAD